MNERKRKENLKVMRQALKQARDRRWTALHDVTDAVGLAIANTDSYRTGRDSPEMNELSRQLDNASARRMLVRDVVETLDTQGRLVSREASLAEVKEKEPYQKRPSVRALKKHRGFGGRSI